MKFVENAPGIVDFFLVEFSERNSGRSDSTSDLVAEEIKDHGEKVELPEVATD